MEEWREQLDGQIEADLQHKKEMLLAEFDKSVEPDYEAPPYFIGSFPIHQLIVKQCHIIEFLDWMVESGYIKRDGDEYVPVSSFVEKRNGYLCVCPDMVSAFFIDTE